MVGWYFKSQQFIAHRQRLIMRVFHTSIASEAHTFSFFHRPRLRGLFALHAESSQAFEQMVVVRFYLVVRAFEQRVHHDFLDIGHGKPFGSSGHRV